MSKYPFLAVDFFDGDKSFTETEDKETHLPSQPEECKSDCDFGSDLLYAECVLESNTYSKVSGKIRLF